MPGNHDSWTDNEYWTGEEKMSEERLRKKHPALQELWDKYQAMLKLVDDGKSHAPSGLSEEATNDLLARLRQRYP